MLSRLCSLRAVRLERLPSSCARYTTSTPSWMAATKASKEVKVKEAEENDSTILKKTDLIKIVANKHDLTLDESKKILDTILENVTEALKDGKSVPFHMFGSFTTYESKSRMGRNPSTGEALEIKAKRRVKFTPSKILKSIVSGETEK